MKDNRLADLNFNDLLQYGGKPDVKHKYEQPLPCTGYCVNCDEKFGIQMSQISHGCDSSDFEDLLGPLPVTSEVVNKPILFLFDRPPINWATGPQKELCQVEFRGCNKWVPVQHYYWTPSLREWPKNIEKISFYGNYLSYLMQKHAMNNIYITNLVKCIQKTSNDSRVETNDPRIETECFNRYLRRELEFFKPEVVFCFSWAVVRLLGTHRHDTFKVVYLCHPAARKGPRQIVDENDRRIEEALSATVIRGQGVLFPAHVDGVKPKRATSKGRISEMFQMSEKEEQALAILRRITGFQTAHQMAPQINVRVASARNILERLVDKGLVVRRGELHTRGEYAALTRLAPP